MFLGEEQVREQGRARPWLNPVQPDLIRGLSDRDTSSCPICLSRTGHSCGHNLQGKASPCATRQSTEEQDISTRGGLKNGPDVADSPKKFLPCHDEQNQERWEVGGKIQQHIVQRVQDIRRTLTPRFSAHQTFHPYRERHRSYCGDRQELKPLIVVVLKH